MSQDCDYDTIYSTAITLVKQAGVILLENISKKKEISEKSSHIDLVTESDKKIEDFLIGNLTTAYPDHKFIGEEQQVEKKVFSNDPTWIIDPIDGTMNFVHSYPHCCISIALYVDKEAQIAFIYNPNLDQFFSARKGQGAYLNGKQISVSAAVGLSHALLGTEIGTNQDSTKMENVQKNLATLMPLCHGIRGLGSCALNIAMVALGATDAYFEFGIHVWDIAAGILIVREAGGVAIDPSGKPIDLMSRRVLCANSQLLADELVSKLHQYYPTPTD